MFVLVIAYMEKHKVKFDHVVLPDINQLSLADEQNITRWIRLLVDKFCTCGFKLCHPTAMPKAHQQTKIFGKKMRMLYLTLLKTAVVNRC